MPVFRIDELNKKDGVVVTICGWLTTKRVSGGIAFLNVRDGSGEIQCVLNKSKIGEDLFEKSIKLGLESSLSLTGEVKLNPRSQGSVELEVAKIEIFQAVTDEYPIGKKEHGTDFLMENRHLWLRSPRQWAIQRIRNQLILGIFEFFEKEHFIKIDSPIFTPSACEGTTTLFEVEYVNGSKVYLSQSGQLYLEAAIASFGRVFDFGPTFRAEKSKTRRHLTEFWMMDAEMAFVTHFENMELQEKFILFLLNRVLDSCESEFKLLERDTAPLKKIKSPFPRLTYNEALDKLHELGSDIKHGEDLGNDDETILTQAFENPIFIEKYPADIKAFYMKRDPQDEKYALCSDLLAPEGYGEIIGGSQREDDYDTLMKRLVEHNLPVESFQWYLDLRKFGSVPHSGFGLGLERLVAWICSVPHLRETIPFARTLYRVFP